MRNIKIRSFQPNVASASVRRPKKGNPRCKWQHVVGVPAPLVPRDSRCRAIVPKRNGRATATCYCCSAMFDLWLSHFRLFSKARVFFQKNLLPLVAPLFPRGRKNTGASPCRDGLPRNHPSISRPPPSSGVNRRTFDMNAFNRGVWRWGKHAQADLTQTDTLAELTQTGHHRN
jgi:hypothetical protein